MGFYKKYSGCGNLPEVQELKELFLKRRYHLGWCDDNGLRMQNGFTEIHFIPENDRLRLCIHDDGMGEKETDIALKLASKVVLKYGYKQVEDEYYKYFKE
jgi:hypothetical protein